MSSPGSLPPDSRFRGPAEEDEVRDLLARAGARAAPPAADLERIRAAAHEAWRESLAAAATRTRPGFAWIPATIAAGIAAAALLLWRAWPAPTPPSPLLVATVERVAGALTREPADAATGASPSALAPGSPVHAGERLATPSAGAGGRAALRLAAGGSLRLDAGTRLRWVSGSELELESGALYYDSFGRDPASPAITLATPVGRLRDVGTQFEARLEAEGGLALRLRVRRGAVALADRSGAIARAGEEWRVARDGTTARRPVAVGGPAWDWVLAIAPPFEIEGQRLEDFLAWVERETGWRVELDPAARSVAAQSIRLHGSIAGLRPEEAIEVVLAGAGLESRLEEGALKISRAAGPGAR